MSAKQNKKIIKKNRILNSLEIDRSLMMRVICICVVLSISRLNRLGRNLSHLNVGRVKLLRIIVLLREIRVIPYHIRVHWWGPLNGENPFFITGG